MNKLYKILEEAVINGNNSFDLKKDYLITEDVLSAMSKIQKGIKTLEEKIIEPKLIGYSNKKIGYNNYKPLDIGSPVYFLNGSYLMYQEPINGGEKVKIFFSEAAIFNYINFRINE